ncbi:MAG: hypothetical protein NPINA01_09140 [Nitrospinaceae bacterium]|nr:MAG: hypothetical protein NPINA01_09140 [Nitrospinaceae bacterium]
MSLLRPGIKIIVGVNILLLFLLFATPLYAGNGLIVTPHPHLKILNQKQNVEAVKPNREAWLRLASVDIGDDEKDCEAKDRRGKCRPLKQLKVNSLHSLQFGEIVSNSGRGARVVIDPVTGSKVVYSGVALGGRYGPAEFELQGQPNKRFVITLPRQIVLTGGNGGGARVSELIAYLPSSRAGKSRKKDGNVFGSFGRDGKARLLVGGTLSLDSDRVTGNFKAPLDVFVDYLP